MTNRIAAVAAVGIASVALVASGAAISTALDPTTELTACVNNSSGVMKLVESVEECSKSETAVTWNVQGLQGKPGEPGPQGVPGEAGPKGEPGADGEAALPPGTPYDIEFVSGSDDPRQENPYYGGYTPRRFINCPGDKVIISASAWLTRSGTSSRDSARYPLWTSTNSYGAKRLVIAWSQYESQSRYDNAPLNLMQYEMTCAHLTN